MWQNTPSGRKAAAKQMMLAKDRLIIENAMLAVSSAAAMKASVLRYLMFCPPLVLVDTYIVF